MGRLKEKFRLISSPSDSSILLWLVDNAKANVRLSKQELWSICSDQYPTTWQSLVIGIKVVVAKTWKAVGNCGFEEYTKVMHWSQPRGRYGTYAVLD
jgi:hypothetical protein